MHEPLVFKSPLVPSAWFKTRQAPGVGALLYGCMLLLFLLPFLSVSCGDAETETLTGFELLSDKDPVIVGTVDSGDANEIRKIVHDHSQSARLLFTLILIGLATSLLAWRSVDSIDAAFGMQVAAIGVLASVGAFFTSGSPIFGPEAHHLVGAGLAGPFAIVQVVLGYNVLSQRWNDERQLSTLDFAIIPAAVASVVSAFVHPIGLLACILVAVVSVVSLRSGPTLFRLIGAVLASLPLMVLVGYIMSR